MSVTVYDLIEFLQSFPPEMEVVADGPEGEEYEVLGIEEYDEENVHCLVINLSEPTR